MNNVAQMHVFRKKFDTQVIYLGDMIEWQDYTGEVYQAVVKSIAYVDHEGYGFASAVKSFPLWEKQEYAVTFEHGMTVAGSAVVRKVTRRKELDKRKIFNPHADRLSTLFN